MAVMEEMLETLKSIENKLDNLDEKGGEEVKGVFNAEEAANFLKVSEDKIYKMIRNNEIGYLKIGTRKVIPVKEAEKFIKENTKRPVDVKKYENNIKHLKTMKG